ncbi:MAG: hypothetical protein HKP01_13340 [Gemmatimonadetes bacterium]|nr:hypothetical protein [Gemmatimonadota bacterium]
MRLHNAMIAEQSHLVLDKYGTEAVEFHRCVETKLEEIGDQNITWGMDSADVGFVRGLTGVRRDFLVVRHQEFREYSVLISARAHRTALHVAWLIMTSPRLANDLQRVLRRDEASAPRFEVGAELDLFDCMDLQAFVGVARLALKYAVRELTGDRGNDDPLMLAFHGSK